MRHYYQENLLMYFLHIENAYFGSNYPKLLEIKQKYDPTGLLDCFRCGKFAFRSLSCNKRHRLTSLDTVGWKGPTDPRYQCYV